MCTNRMCRRCVLSAESTEMRSGGRDLWCQVGECFDSGMFETLEGLAGDGIPGYETAAPMSD